MLAESDGKAQRKAARRSRGERGRGSPSEEPTGQTAAVVKDDAVLNWLAVARHAPV
jgi:hypothetical protein